MTRKNALKACPFCGAQMTRYERYIDHPYREDCPLGIVNFYTSYVDEWNTRSSVCEDARELAETQSYCEQCSCDMCIAQQKVKRLNEAIEHAKLPGSRCWSCSCGWVGCYTPAEVAKYGEPSECQDCYRERLVEQDTSAVAALAKVTRAPTMTRDDTLARIDRYLRATRTTPSGFSRAALRDPNFLTQVRRGRQMRQATIDRVNAWLDSKEDMK